MLLIAEGEEDRAGALRIQSRDQACARPGFRARRAALAAAGAAFRNRSGIVAIGEQRAQCGHRHVRGERCRHPDDRGDVVDSVRAANPDCSASVWVWQPAVAGHAAGD